MVIKPKEKYTPADEYVEGPLGLRQAVLAILIAALLGVGIRVYLSPERIKNWITQALEADQVNQFGLSFKGADLKLARGAIPQIAIELTGIEANPAKACRNEPSIRIEKIRLPINLSKLLLGRVTIGVVAGEDIFIDLEGLKTRCPGVADKRAGETLKRAPAQAQVAEPLAPRSWWSKEQLSAVKERISGFEFSRVTVSFENNSKKVMLDSLTLEAGAKVDSLHLETDLMIPSELVYDEKIPPLNLDITATATEAEVSMKAGFSEGKLLVKAQLKPAVNGALETELLAHVENVPLSMLVPVVTKSGIVKGAFRPRFMWMNCRAQIHGHFQGLFNENPLRLTACEVVGNGARLSVSEATRRPDGSWDPFMLQLSNVDLGQVLETFDWRGPDGIISDYGRVEGQVSLLSKTDARFAGKVSGAVIRFSNRNVRAEQRVNQLDARIEIESGKIRGKLDHLDFDGGEFDGGLEVALENHATEGTVKAQIKHMKLNEAVQKVLSGGQVGDITGHAVAELDEGQLASLTGQVSVFDLAGRDLRFREATVQAELASDHEFNVTLRSPELEVHRSSTIFKAAAKLFFAHEFAGDWIRVRESVIRARILKNGDVKWDRADGHLENGRIHVMSSGGFDRGRDLFGWVNVDYPSVKRLKWELSGKLDSPILNDDSEAISDLREKNADDQILGLPKKVKAEPSESEESVASKTKEGLRALGEKVMRGAKNMLPAKALEKESLKSDKENSASE